MARGRRPGRRAKNGAKRRNGAYPLKGIKQGVGATTQHPFGEKNYGNPNTWFDAFHPHHLPLPRAVGPYTTVRVTVPISTPRRTMLFAPMLSYEQSFSRLKGWTSSIAVGEQTAGPMNALNGAFNYLSTALEGDGYLAARVVPSAFSVQIMNPEALQTTNGIVYAGRLRTKPRLENRTMTWQEFADQFISYSSPRLLASAKLAMRGVQIDSVPYNMAELAEFLPIQATASGVFDWDGFGATGSIDTGGFAPIVVYNPDAVALQYLVTMELRVRFDLTNPAVASHVHHHPASDITWGNALQMLDNAGNGVRDIVERVANVGMFAKQAYGAYKAIQGSAPLLALGA